MNYKDTGQAHEDAEETIEVQENTGSRSTRQMGDRHFTEEGRDDAITIDLVLQARAKMAEERVNGPEDSIVSEMVKQVPQENMYEITRCFQVRFLGLEEAPSS